jgi:hypothetical protein
MYVAVVTVIRRSKGEALDATDIGNVFTFVPRMYYDSIQFRMQRRALEYIISQMPGENALRTFY